MFRFPSPAQAGCRRSLTHRLLQRISPLTATIVVAFIVLFTGADALKAEAGNLPNIVFMMADEK